jgi:hypothetical protein
VYIFFIPSDLQAGLCSNLTRVTPISCGSAVFQKQKYRLFARDVRVNVRMRDKYSAEEGTALKLTNRLALFRRKIQ